MNALVLPLRLARRELRGGIKGFRVFLASLALGVAAIAAIGSLAAAIEAGLQSDAQTILGGDVELRLVHRPAPEAAQDWLEGNATLTRTTNMRAMARPAAGDATRRMLVELKAVDSRYPLYGAVRLADGGALQPALAARDGVSGAVVEPQVLARLDVNVGERIRVGDANLEIRGVIEREPDRGTGFFQLGPRVMVEQRALEATGLVQPGSLIYYFYKARLPGSVSASAWIEELEAANPDVPWRIRDLSNASPGLQNMVERVRLYLTLVGLTALLVGGVGVANAVRAYLDARVETIATIKCLGAPAVLVFRTYLAQIAVMALAGTVLGIAFGAALPFFIGDLLANVLPVPVKAALYPAPLLLAGVFGLLTALVFSLWSLARSRDVPAARLFRQLLSNERRWPRAEYVVATAVAIAALAVLAIITAVEQRLAVWFVTAVVVAFIAFRIAGWGIAGLARLAGRAQRRLAGRPGLRLALANLHRPGAATTSVVLSLGIVLMVLVAVASIQGNLSRQVAERMPAAAPTFFFIDIQPDQVATFEALLAGFDRAEVVERMPMLRARIVRINGVPVDEAEIDPQVAWAVGGERGLTYAARPPDSASIVAGAWWPADYQGPPIISFDANIAAGMGIGVGDTLSFSVLGREITATIANLRSIDWASLGMNFTVVFAPGTLESAPHTHIATVRAPREAELNLLTEITDRLANVSAIRVRDALETVEGVLTDIGAAVRGTAAVTLLAGTLVLAGAIAAGHRRRVYDAVVLKVLGARRRTVLRVFLLEFGLLGLATAILAGVLGSIASWYVVTRFMRADWVFLPEVVGLTVLACTALTLVLALAGTWHALGRKAAPLLRNE